MSKSQSGQAKPHRFVFTGDPAAEIKQYIDAQAEIVRRLGLDGVANRGELEKSLAPIIKPSVAHHSKVSRKDDVLVCAPLRSGVCPLLQKTNKVKDFQREDAAASARRSTIAIFQFLEWVENKNMQEGFSLHPHCKDCTAKDKPQQF